MNVSVLNPDGHGFDYVVPRQIGDTHNPDFVFAEQRPKVGQRIAGLILVHPQNEYGDRQRHADVDRVVYEYLDKKEVMPIVLDTLHRNNRTSSRTEDELTALMCRFDLVISSRLHGLVFLAQGGRSVIAIDPIAGGGKVTSQAMALGWPLVFNSENLTVDGLRDAVEQCLDGSLSDVIAVCSIAPIGSLPKPGPNLSRP